MLAPTLSNGTPYYNLYTPQLVVSYAPDVFGRNRRAVEGLEAQAEAQRFQLEATYLTLTSNVVTAAIQEAVAARPDRGDAEIIAVETEQLLASCASSSALGQIAEADVRGPGGGAGAGEAALPPLQKQLAQQRDCIAALVGRFPARSRPRPSSWPTLELPPDLPVSLPAKLVEQRPDVRAAEANAACGQRPDRRGRGQPAAADHPHRQRRQRRRRMATSCSRPAPASGTLAGSLTQPVFDGGTLLHQQRAADAALRPGRRAVPRHRHHRVAERRRRPARPAIRCRRAEGGGWQPRGRRATASPSSARSCDLGSVSYLALLTAQQTYQQAEVALVQAQAGRLADTAALFQALGGGWWNPPPPAAESDGPAAAAMRAKPEDKSRGWLDSILEPFGL